MSHNWCFVSNTVVVIILHVRYSPPDQTQLAIAEGMGSRAAMPYVKHCCQHCKIISSKQAGTAPFFRCLHPSLDEHKKSPGRKWTLQTCVPFVGKNFSRWILATHTDFASWSTGKLWKLSWELYLDKLLHRGTQQCSNDLFIWHCKV